MRREDSLYVSAAYERRRRDAMVVALVAGVGGGRGRICPKGETCECTALSVLRGASQTFSEKVLPLFAKYIIHLEREHEKKCWVGDLMCLLMSLKCPFFNPLQDSKLQASIHFLSPRRASSLEPSSLVSSSSLASSSIINSLHHKQQQCFYNCSHEVLCVTGARSFFVANFINNILRCEQLLV